LAGRDLPAPPRVHQTDHETILMRQRAFGYLSRPVTPGPLGELVQQALDSEAWQDDIRVVSARPEWITLDVRCKIDAADRTTHFLREITAHRSATANAG